MATLTIGKVAKATGMGVETLRFYEREGLLAAPQRSAAGYRLYPESSIARLRFVRRAKQLGFTLTEIRNLLSLSDGSGSQRDVKAMTAKKLDLLTQRIADLERIRAALSELDERCDGDGCIADCPVIAALNDDEDTGVFDVEH